MDRNASATDRGARDLSRAMKVTCVTVNVLLLIATVFGNFLMIKAFLAFTSLRTASNTILVSLSVTNSLIVVVIILNILIVHGSGNISDTSINRLCYSSSALRLLIISVIILHLTLISVERFIAIKSALRYHTLVTKHRVVIACVVVWLWSVLVMIAFPQTLKVDSKQAFRSFLQALTPCSSKRFSSFPASAVAYLIFLIISLFLIPILIIVASYTYIFVVSYKHQKKIHGQRVNIQDSEAMKHEMKVARTVTIVVGMCLVSYIPLVMVTLYRVSISPMISKYYIYIAHFIASLNACWNPLIYGWRNEDFKRAFRRIVKCN